MSDRVFVDTNILIYAHDLDAGHKRTLAAALLKDLWTTRLGVLSTQVLQEFYVNVTRKISSPLSPAAARGIVAGYCVWQIEVLAPDTVVRASEIEERHDLSFWDALIVTAALQGHAAKILSEDLNPGQTIEGVLNSPSTPANRDGGRDVLVAPHQGPAPHGPFCRCASRRARVALTRLKP